MRKITKEIVSYFLKGIPSTVSNSKVEVQDGISYLKLHGNKIAEKNMLTGKIKITSAGWSSNTTKERLNGIPNVNIQQVNFKWFLNGTYWDGKWININ